MKRAANLFSAVALLVMIFPVPVSGQDAKADFLRQYEPHAARLRDAYTNITCKYTTTWNDNDGKPAQIQKFHARYNFRNFTLDGTNQMLNVAGYRPVPRVTCQNPRYGFSLENSGKEGKRVLTNLKPANPGARPQLCPLSFPFANPDPFDRSYFDIIRRPDCRVISFADITWRDRSVKQLIVDIRHTDTATGKPMTIRTGFCFLAEHDWVCGGSLWFNDKDPRKLEVEEVYDYEPRADELPVPKSKEQWLSEPDRKTWRLTHRIEISEFKRSPKPFADSEFTLSAYGFPEPEGLPEAPPETEAEADVLAVPDPPASSSIPWVWIAAGVGVILFGVGVVYWRRAQRSSQVAKALPEFTPTRGTKEP